ncbi:MAG: hypothetical protein WA733_10565 [Methylocystis sp.]
MSDVEKKDGSLQDAGGGDGSQRPSQENNRNWIGRHINKIRSYFQNRRAKKREMTSSDRAALRTSNASLASAAFTAAVVAVGVFQYFTFDNQLRVMQGQLDVMKAGQRPWIKIDVVAGALKFNPQSGDATFQYGFRIRNVGNSVAVGVRVDAKVIAPPFDGRAFDDVAAAQEAFCAATIANKATEYADKNHEGINLFPNESYPTDQNDAFGGNYGGSSNISKAEMLAAEPPTLAAQPSMREHVKGAFAPYLIGCVTYQLSLTPGRHQTGFIYGIHRFDPANGPSVPLFIKMDNDLSPPNIVFEKWFFGTGKID